MTEAVAARPRAPKDGYADSCAELTGLLFDGGYAEVHADIRDLLYDPAFDPCEGLAAEGAGRLALDRARFVHGRLERPREILCRPRRLFALAEWPVLLDVSVFSVLMIHYNLCLGTVLDQGADRTGMEDVIDELDRLASFGTYMVTELGYGNNAAAMRTEAVHDPVSGTFVLNTPDVLAQKFMSGSGVGDAPVLAVVMARLKAEGRDHGVFPFVVPLSDSEGPCAGVRVRPCPEKPVQGLDNGVTWFDQVRIPCRNLLHGGRAAFSPDGAFRPEGGNQRKRFLAAMSRIQPGRLCMSSAAVSTGRAAAYIALRYAARRLTNAPGRHDVPVIDYRSHQRALFTALAKVYAMTLLVNHAKREYLRRQDAVTVELNQLISITKALSTWEMSEVVAVCRERCGAQGLLSVNRLVDYGSLLQGLVTAEGDNQVLLATTAGQIIAGSGDEPRDAAFRPGDGDLCDPAFAVGALRHREQALLRAARAAMADESGGRSYFEAWNDTVGAGLAMARVRGVRTALECLVEALGELGDRRAHEALALLATLYGLTEIQRDAGWYLARGVLTADQVEALPATLDRLCARILPHVETLIGGFQLSPELLRAPIAADDYATAFPSPVPTGETAPPTL